MQHLGNLGRGTDGPQLERSPAMTRRRGRTRDTPIRAQIRELLRARVACRHSSAHRTVG